MNYKEEILQWRDSKAWTSMSLKMVIVTRVQIQRIRLTYSKYSQLDKLWEFWSEKQPTSNDRQKKYHTSLCDIKLLVEISILFGQFLWRVLFSPMYVAAILPRFQGYLAWVKVRGNLWYFSLVITQWAGSIWHPPCWSSKQKRDQILWPDGMHLIATDWK